MDFPHLGTSTCRSECGLSKSKYVSSLILVLSLSTSVIFLLPVGTVVHLSCSFSAKWSTCLFDYTLHDLFFLLQLLVYR